MPNFKSDASFFSNEHLGWGHVVWMLLIVLVWLGFLDARHLIPSDEGRYAEIAREMLVSGNWIVPRYNDYLYFEKPPLQMWATAIIFHLFGLGEWQARAWTGITSLLNLFLVGYTSYRLWGIRAGTIAALVLASSPLWVIGGHFNSLDMGVAFFMSGALCSLILALHAPVSSSAEKKWMMACWAMMALSVLSKGLIGVVLPGLVLLVYSVSGKDWQSWKRLHWIKGLIVFLLITLPWFILIIQKHPSFFDFFFIHEHFGRFANNEHQRSAAWYFFLPLLIVGFIPWLGQLPQAVILSFEDRANSSNSFKPLWLCFIWVIVITVFFSLSNSKLPGYIFPVIPALAILAGKSLLQLFENKNRLSSFGSSIWQIQLILFGLLFFIGFFFLPQIARTGESYEASSYAAYAKIIGASLLIGLLGCLWAWWLRQDALKSFLIFSSTMILVALSAGTGHQSVGRLLSGYDLAMQAKPIIRQNDPLYGIKMLDHTIPFYLEHPMIMVEFKDELAFGIGQEPKRWIPTEDEWIGLWLAHPETPAYALMSVKTYEQLLQQHLPMKVIAQDPLRIIVGKPVKK